MTYEVVSQMKCKREDIKKAVQEAVETFLGIYSCAKAGIMFVENDHKTGIIQVEPKYVDQVKTALSLIKEINKKQAIIKTIRVSGMIKKAKKGGAK